MARPPSAPGRISAAFAPFPILHMGLLGRMKRGDAAIFSQRYAH